MTQSDISQVGIEAGPTDRTHTEVADGRRTAIETLECLAAQSPNDASIACGLGHSLYKAGQFEKSAGTFRRAIELAPQLAEAWGGLGAALQAADHHEEALEVLKKAVALAPTSAEHWVNLGLEWQIWGFTSRASQCYREALRLEPTQLEAWTNLGVSLQEAGDVSLSAAATRAALEIADRHSAAWSNLILTSQYEPTLVAADHLRLANAAARRLPAEQSLPLPQLTAKPRRLRVAYLSADFYAHPIGWMAAPAIAAHDKDSVEVHILADNRRVDSLTTRLQQKVEHWHDVRGLSDQTLRTRIMDLGIDVLIDLGGHTANNRLGVLAQRAAPRQLAWLGYAATSGIPAIDGIILGRQMAPQGIESGFSERVLRLPRASFAYAPPEYAPPPREPISGPRPVVLGSFGNPAKIGPAVIQAWARILAQLPEARLVLKWRSFADPAVSARLYARFAMFGVASSRIDLRSASPHADMLQEYRDIDIALDPYPFCGGLTTCEALWMGVPVVTLPWQRPLSRQSLEILSTLGLDELVAHTPAGYVRTVCDLAGDWQRLHALQAVMRPRMRASNILNGRDLAARLEVLYRREVQTPQTADPE